MIFQQMKKMVPLITCDEFLVGHGLRVGFFLVSTIFDSDLGVQIDSVE